MIPTITVKSSNYSVINVVEDMDSNGLVSLKWIKLNRWCELTGDTRDAVHARRKTGKWQDDIHCRVRDGNLWINVEEGQSWVESEMKRSRAG